MAAGILTLAFFALWLAASTTGGWSWAVAGAVGAVGVTFALVLGSRLKVVDAEAAGPFAHFASVLGLMLMRTPGRMRDAAAVAALAVGARRKAPVFVRLKLRPADPLAASAAICAMSSAPGLVVVDADAGSLLAHALCEGDVDVADMQKLERHALGSMGGPP